MSFIDWYVLFGELSVLFLLSGISCASILAVLLVSLEAIMCWTLWRARKFFYSWKSVVFSECLNLIELISWSWELSCLFSGTETIFYWRLCCTLLRLLMEPFFLSELLRFFLLSWLVVTAFILLRLALFSLDWGLELSLISIKAWSGSYEAITLWEFRTFLLFGKAIKSSAVENSSRYCWAIFSSVVKPCFFFLFMIMCTEVLSFPIVFLFLPVNSCESSKTVSICSGL